MKELYIFLSIYVTFIVFYRTEAARKENEWMKQQSHARKSVNERWSKRNSEKTTKENKRLRLNASLERNVASQKKRQFVPGIPFLNFPRPHIHRIIVHHHPGRS